MIDNIVKAIAAYRGLDTQGKKMFRAEVGLEAPQKAGARTRTRKARSDKGIKRGRKGETVTSEAPQTATIQ